MGVKNEILQNKLTLTVDHNPYPVTVFANDKRKNKKLIIFPVFIYQGEQQYRDLINPLVKSGYRVLTISLLEFGDLVLSLGYYYRTIESLLEMVYSRGLIVDDDELILMGFGIGANIVSHLQSYKSEALKFSKMILISPVNHYKDEYHISNVVENFKIPTHIFFGQFDSVNSVKERFAIFQAGRDNPNVHFTAYPAVGHYLYYKNKTSLEFERLYNSSGFDMLLGDTKSKSRVTFLPSENLLNEQFFKHLTDVLEDIPSPKRIALLTDSSPLFINGVQTVVELLKSELDKLGYETYVVALWKEHDDFGLLPTPFHIPVIASYAKMLKNHKELMLLKTFKVKQNAKMLALFGFDYLHLHTEFMMGKIAVELAKITDINMPYTSHTLWKLYYENKFGKFGGDFLYALSKVLLLNHVFRDSPVIIVPSKKSYDMLRANYNIPKIIRIIPSAINKDRFAMTDKDKQKVEKLRKQYKLKDKVVFGYVGRVSAEKNIGETIDYISRIRFVYPNIVFMIVGAGDASESLKEIAKKHGLEKRVIFVGQVENTDLKYYYPLLDVFVTASTFETQGLTYFEAATSGTLILARKDKAIEGVFEDGRNAYLYSNYEEWKERVIHLLHNDNSHIILEAKQTMKEFGQDEWAKRILEIYQELND